MTSVMAADSELCEWVKAPDDLEVLRAASRQLLTPKPEQLPCRTWLHMQQRFVVGAGWDESRNRVGGENDLRAVTIISLRRISIS